MEKIKTADFDQAFLRLLKEHTLPVQIEGIPYILGSIILTIACYVVYSYLKASEASANSASWVALSGTVLFGVFAAFCIWFYRNPKVVSPTDDLKAVLSSANGTVLKIETVAGQKIGLEQAKKISIFMSPFDVHINRAPIAGTIETLDSIKGKFFKADLDKASAENEHNWVVMKSESGVKVAFAQIAGFVARRIVVYVQPGNKLSRGERYGMIRFGSRAEIMVPANAEILVQPGSKTVAGITKIARLQ